MGHWTDEYLTMVADCERRESRLTDWEREFIDSMRRQLEAGLRPTLKQTERLDEVWDKATAKG